MLAELEEQRQGWGPVIDGLFGRSVEPAIAALGSVRDRAADIRRRKF